MLLTIFKLKRWFLFKINKKPYQIDKVFIEYVKYVYSLFFDKLLC